MRHSYTRAAAALIGKKADLVVLSDNLSDTDAYAIHLVDVELTMLDGEVVYEN